MEWINIKDKEPEVGENCIVWNVDCAVHGVYQGEGKFDYAYYGQDFSTTIEHAEYWAVLVKPKIVCEKRQTERIKLILCELLLTPLNGDISDIGNAIGMALNLTEDEKEDFLAGLKHGWSIADGTHE
jgi:hypothetical protein